MTMGTINYYFDDTHPMRPYLRELVGNKKEVFFPQPNSTTVPVPERDDKGGWPGLWPCWNGAFWDMKEDHRGETGYVNRQPVKIADLGPLPAGWKTGLEPTPLELKQRAKGEILYRLAELDAKSTRSIRAIGVLTNEIENTVGISGNPDLTARLANEKKVLAGLEAKAQAERSALAAIQAEIAGLGGE
jgi:hypothetical protein